VLARERLAFVLGHDPGLAVSQVLDREVGGVAAVGVGHRIGAERLRLLEQEIERDAAEVGAELGPLGDAVDVAGHGLEREPGELLPTPLALLRDHAVNAEAPLPGLDLGRRAGGEHREAGLGVLPGREMLGELLRRAPAPAETARYELGHSSIINV
jgi:hypothetical protein